jgi:hypothetical protein
MSRERINVRCLVCDKEFSKCPSAARRFKTCSLECRGKYSSRLYANRIEKTCEVCDEPFYVKPSHYDSRFTCGTVCKYKRLEDHLSNLNGGPGENSANWKGGRFVCPAGYTFVLDPGNPMSNSGGYVREHRLVVSKHLGRYLTGDEVVHHIDENKSNNSIENLLVMSSAEHMRHHTKEREFTRDKIGRITGLKSKEAE